VSPSKISYKLIPKMTPSQLLDTNKLSDFGVASELRDYLLAFVSANHPGDQDRLYHNLNHTLEVANLFLGIIFQFGLANRWKVLGFLTCLLHDLDPYRTPNTPPSVERTIEFIEFNEEIQIIIKFFCENFEFTFDQIKTLILATDYSDNPEERQIKKDRFIKECEIYFQGEFFPTKNDQFTNLGYVLGEILAYSDKLATYIQSIDVVLQRIKGLAFELRTLNNSESPTDIELIKNTGEFINGELFENVMFRVLPETYQNTLLNNLRLFD
jgi:hypothetical protein